MLSLSKGLLALSVLVRSALAVPASDASSALFAFSGLNLAAKSARKLYLGTATNSEQWNDTTYFNILKNNAEFGQVTPANVMKWVRVSRPVCSDRTESDYSTQFATEPEEGVFTFQDGDIIADFTEKTGKLLRGHNCVWHNQLPDWLETGTFSAPELAFIVSRHCFNLVNHYQGHV